MTKLYILLEHREYFMLVFIPQSRGTHQYLEGEVQVTSIIDGILIIK